MSRSIWKSAGPRRDLALGTAGVTALALLVSGVPVVVSLGGAGVAAWVMGKALARIPGERDKREDDDGGGGSRP